MNDVIKNNLLNLYSQNKSIINGLTFEKNIDQLINEFKDSINIETGLSDILTNEVQKKNHFEKLKTNKKYLSSFNKCLNLNWDESEIIKGFISDIKYSLKLIQKAPALPLNVIFIEYDYNYHGYWCGYGSGEYPFLEEPSYIDFDYHTEAFNGLGRLKMHNIFRPIVDFNTLTEEIDFGDSIMQTEFGIALHNTYVYKTYLLIHEAFKEINSEVSNIINNPCMIYSNEHDCEAMNIYVL